MTNAIVFCLLCVFGLHYVENANILAIFGIPAPSHFMMYKAITEELASRGHDVDVFTSFPKETNIYGLNYIPIPNIFVNKRRLSPLEFRQVTVEGIMNIMLGGEFIDYTLCERLFQADELKKLRNSTKKYDLLILEIFTADCLFGFAHTLQLPVIGLTSSVDLPWGANRMGNPDNPSYIPNYFRPFPAEISVFDRVFNALTLLHTKLVHNGYMQIQNKEARDFFGDGLPYLDDIVSNTSLIIVNSHFSLNQARPSVPNFIEAAGLHIKEPQPLEHKLQEFIGASKFVYFSLGTVSSWKNSAPEKFQVLFDIFKELHLKVIWRSDKDKLPMELTMNEHVYMVKWTSQLNILCHPNISLFITHNGLMGTQEAVYCAVPMLSIPLFADQYLNAKNMADKGLAQEINLETLTKEEARSVIKQMIEIEDYRKNAKKLSNNFKDRPRKPMEEAIFWIEYVLRYNGAQQLRSKAADLFWYQYYLIDVIIFLLVFLILLITSVILFLRMIRKIFSSRTKISGKKFV